MDIRIRIYYFQYSLNLQFFVLRRDKVWIVFKNIIFLLSLTAKLALYWYDKGHDVPKNTKGAPLILENRIFPYKHNNKYNVLYYLHFTVINNKYMSIYNSRC